MNDIFLLVSVLLLTSPASGNDCLAGAVESIGSSSLLQRARAASRSITWQRTRLSSAAAEHEAPVPNHPPQCWYSNPEDEVPTMTLLTNVANVPVQFQQCLRQNRIAYAKAYGLEYCEFDGRLSSDLSFSLQKWMSVKSLFQPHTTTDADGKPRELIWWLDADALIANMSVSIMDLVNRYSDKDLILTGDCTQGCHGETLDGKTNAGVFIARNTPWMANFTEMIFNNAAETKSPSDRKMIEQFWQTFPEEFLEHATVRHMRSMDSVTFLYQPGDLVLHLAGSTPTAAKSDGDNWKWTQMLFLCDMLGNNSPSAVKFVLDQFAIHRSPPTSA